jgi:hypothetical protein
MHPSVFVSPFLGFSVVLAAEEDGPNRTGHFNDEMLGEL